MLVTDAPFSTATIEDYAPLVGAERVERMREKGTALRGQRVLHINATAVGGGVAELLLSLVPLMRDAGLDVDWYVLDADPPFFEVTKQYHNALQGKPTAWSTEFFETYWRGCEANARLLNERLGHYDIIVVHDPQPLVLRTLLQDANRWIWRCHIDLTSPSEAVWEKLVPHLAGYDLLVFSAPEYVPAEIVAERIVTALPCIDPFRGKNRALPAEEVERVLRRYGVDPARPYLLQVSRFDPWKDPLGVLSLFHQVRAEVPGLQLVYMAAMAGDDPEGQEVYERTRAAAGDDADVILLALDVPAGRVAENALEVNAMQRGATVVLQKSIREGFGLVVAEALFKEKAVVAGNVGGIRYQIEDGVSGFLVESPEQGAERTLRLLRDPELRRALGRRGRETVVREFLFTRLLEQYLDWFADLGAR
jgi:trehalose synthase